MLILRPLRVRPIALLWSGLALSAIGDQLYAVALAWVAVRLIGADAGYLSALQAGAVLVVALFGGPLADRWDARRAMIGADLARAAILLALVAVGLALPLSVWVLVPAAALLAGAQAVFRPALQAALPRLVPETSLLAPTNGLVDSTERIARFAGSGLAGLLSGLVPVLHFFTLDALSFLASAAAVAALGGTLRPVPPAVGAKARRGLARGFRAVGRHPLLAFVLATGGALNGLWYATFFLGVPLIVEERSLGSAAGGGLGAFATVMASYGATNLAANLAVGSRPLGRPARLIFGGNLVLGAGMAALGLAAGLVPGAALLPAMAAAAGLSAIGGPMQDITVATLRQTLLAPDEIAAAVRAFMVVNNAGMLIAMVAAPAIFATCGSAASIVGAGVGVAAIGAAGWAIFARVEPHPAGATT